jgi:hypothetical protein
VGVVALDKAKKSANVDQHHGAIEESRYECAPVCRPGQKAASLLVYGVAGAIGAIFLMGEALRRENVPFAAYYVSGTTGVAILTMSVMRDMLRGAYLKPYFHRQQFVLKIQWSVFPLFGCYSWRT